MTSLLETIQSVMLTLILTGLALIIWCFIFIVLSMAKDSIEK